MINLEPRLKVPDRPARFIPLREVRFLEKVRRFLKEAFFLYENLRLETRRFLVDALRLKLRLNEPFGGI